MGPKAVARNFYLGGGGATIESLLDCHGKAWLGGLAFHQILNSTSGVRYHFRGVSRAVVVIVLILTFSGQEWVRVLSFGNTTLPKHYPGNPPVSLALY